MHKIKWQVNINDVKRVLNAKGYIQTHTHSNA